MTARVQIQIEAQDAASGVLRAITSQFGVLGGAVSDMSDMFSKNTAVFDLYQRGLTDMSVTTADVAKAEEAAAAATARFAETITMLAVNALKEAINSSIEYAAEVEKVSLMSGASAAQSSRLIQVLDDYKITTDDITTAMRKMTAQGYAPTIETVAQLADQYNSLNTTQEKNAFLIENLGRGGAEWAKVLSLGSDALLEMNGNIDENLILTEKNIQAAEDYRLNIDQLEDSWQGVTILLGNAVIPALNNVFETINQVADAQTSLENQGMSPYEAHRLAIYGFKAEIQDAPAMIGDYGESMKELNTTYSESIPVMGEMITNYDELIGSIVDYQDEIDRYQDTSSNLKETEAELLEQQALLSAELEKAVGSYGANSNAAADVQAKLDGVNGKLEDNKKKLAENEEAHRRWAAQTIFAFAQARAAADGSISEVEGKLLIDAGQALGLFDENTARTMDSVNQAFDTLDTSNAQDVINTLKEQLEALVSGSYIINIGVDAPELPTVPPPTTPPGGTPPPGYGPPGGGSVGGSATTNYFYGNVTYVSDGVTGDVLEYR